MLGADGKIRDYGGGAGEAILGLDENSEPEEDLVGKSLSAVLPGLAEALREKRWVWKAESGSDLKYYRIAETSLNGADGSRIVVLSDITDRRRRQRRLERQNDLFEKAQDLADVGAWEYDVESGTLTWTEQVYAIHGLPEDMNPTPEKAIEHYHQEDRSRIEEAFTQAIEEGIPYDEELRIRRPGGEVRWVRTYGEPQTKEGAVVRIRGAFKDITDRKRRERRANRLRRKYQTLLEGAPDAIVLADQETGRIEEVNQEAAELMGAAPEELVGRNQAQLHPDGEAGRYRQLFEEVCRRSARTGEPETIDRFEDGSPTYVQSDAGEKVPVEISATTIELWGDRLILGIFRDVTEQRRREEALREAKEEAQQASQMKSSLLANMSHEIRTPLTSVIGFSEAIGGELEAMGDCPDDADLSRLARFSEMIEEGGTRLLETLDSVLNLSKLEAGQMELTEEAVDLSEEAEALTEELLPQAEESGVDYEVETNGTPVRARADQGGVQIALRNLVSNAIKYTGEGGTVRVRAYQEDGWAALEVEDTGIGMDPKKVEDLFEPFRQASEGWGREYEGTGVGLAVTKKATEQMGGNLEVETEKGEGTCFTVRLPRNEERPHEEA
jgi:PAS domain S-box-containing protein